MIVVKVELHSAITGEVSTLGQMVIANDGKTSRDNNSDRGSYNVMLGRRFQLDLKTIVQEPQRKTRVENYPRLAYPVWSLVKRALNNLKLP